MFNQRSSLCWGLKAKKGNFRIVKKSQNYCIMNQSIITRTKGLARLN